MLRSFLIYLSKAAWAQRIVTGWKFARRAASRFIAGETIADAIGVVRDLNARGINATLDCLGEHTSSTEEAIQAAQVILDVLDEIQRAGVRSNVSIKLTQIGMGLDDDVCLDNLVRILARAKQYGNFVRIDMEDTPYTDTTIQLFTAMLSRGYTVATVGMVVQSYLYRTEGDVRELLKAGTTFRLVKGAYKEPADRAYPKKADVDANFDLLTRVMVDAAVALGSKPVSPDGRIPPLVAVGSHDEKRIQFARRYAEQAGLPRQALEFQMLHGIRRDLQEQLAAEGYPVRIYVPFGTHWYPYFMRRLAERPANIWFFVSNFFRR